jgi:hypothetical protein
MSIPNDDMLAVPEGAKPTGIGRAIDDGGAAFPVLELRTPDGKIARQDEGGMSLRDWFAGQALGGWCAAQVPGDFSALARDAYAFADAMLKARGRS